MRKILKNQLYLKVLLSDLISNLGDTLYFIALMTYVTELKDSNLAVSIINLSETIPILFTVFFGIIADRTMNKVETIIKTLWIRVGLYLVVAMVMNFKASIMVVILASMVNLIHWDNLKMAFSTQFRIGLWKNQREKRRWPLGRR